MKIKILFSFLLISILTTTLAFAQTNPSIVVLYTKSGEMLEDFENLSQTVQFTIENYNKTNNVNFNFNIIELDDKNDPLYAEKKLTDIILKNKPIAIIGPTYSNVGLGLKDFINKNQIPMISIFATHNDLTFNTQSVFRICASNKSLVKTLVDHLTPQISKNKLSVTAFKDLNDFYSTDLADTFTKQIALNNDTHVNQVLFRGLSGLDRLKDINSKVWNPHKKEVLFLSTQDNVSSRILTAMETEPYLVATIEPVNFIGLFKKLKKVKTHIRMVSTVQWQPHKYEYSKKIEEAFLKKFNREIKIPSALTYDATLAFLTAFERSHKKKISLRDALKDGTKVQGMTGNLAFSQNGERVNTLSFIREDLLK